MKRKSGPRSSAGTIRVVNDPTESAGRHQSKDSSLFVISENIGYLAAITFRLMERDLNRRFQIHGASFGQWPILIHLWARDGQTQRELCRRVVVEEATMTNTLNRMAAQGLIARKRDAEDGRVQRIFLTPKGERLRDPLVRAAMEANEAALTPLGARERANLRKVLDRIVAGLRG